MTSAQQWSAIVGALLPMVLAVIMQSHWSNTVRSWVAFIACVAAAFVTTYFAGTLVFTKGDATTIGADVALVGTAAWALYHGFYKPSGLAPAIEAKTNLPHIGIIPDAPAPPANPETPAQ